MQDLFFSCEECGLEFTDGDILYFKPVPYIKELMDDCEVEITPYCKYCIVSFAA